MTEDKKIKQRNQQFNKNIKNSIINERTSFSLKLRKEKLTDKIMRNRFKVNKELEDSDLHLIIDSNELELKEEFKLYFENDEDKIGILIDILMKSTEMNKIKFAINYIRCLTDDEITLQLLKDYLNKIIELVFRFLVIEDKKVIYEVTWMIQNITQSNEDHKFFFNRTNLEVLINLLENSEETYIKENVLSIFNNILGDLQSYNLLKLLVPSFPSILKKLLVEQNDEKNVEFKMKLIKIIYQVCSFSVELIHTKFNDEQTIHSILKFIQIGTYCCTEFLLESLQYVNLLIISSNELIFELFLVNNLVNILINLFDQNIDSNQDTILTNIEITKILSNLLNGKASDCEKVLSNGIIPFFDYYLDKFISSNSTFSDENYLDLLGNITFLCSNISAGVENQCEELIIHSNLPTKLLDIYKKVNKTNIHYDILYMLYCSIVNGSKEVINKVLFNLNSFEIIFLSLNKDKEIIGCSLNFLYLSLNIMKNSSNKFEKLNDILNSFHIIEKLECLINDKNTEISANVENILNLIWEYNDKFV